MMDQNFKTQLDHSFCCSPSPKAMLDEYILLKLRQFSIPEIILLILCQFPHNKKIAKLYREKLDHLNKYIKPLKILEQTDPNYWHYPFLLKDTDQVNNLRKLLAQHGIETRRFFIPIHLQPPYRKPEYEGQFPNSEDLAKRGIIIPSGPGLKTEQIEKICDLIEKFFR